MKLFRIAGGVGMLASACLLAHSADAAIALTAAAYTQNFDTLAAAGTNVTALPTGWEISESGGGARDNNLYSANDGSSNTGDTYSYGISGSTDRALGSLTSGSLESTFGAIFQNATGATVTAFTLNYIGEQWRRGTSVGDSLRFQYLVGATSIASGTWTDFTAFDFDGVNTGVAAMLNGNAAANRLAIGGTVNGLSILNGATFGIRWMDTDSAGSDDGLAIDSLSLSTTQAASAVPEPASWLMMVGGFGLLGATMRRRKTVVHAF